jgi:hypothetical protein
VDTICTLAGIEAGQGFPYAMSDRDAGKNADEKESTVKRPYTRPEFRCERVFETMALSCGKIERFAGQCRFNRKTS